MKQFKTKFSWVIELNNYSNSPNVTWNICEEPLNTCSLKKGKIENFPKTLAPRKNYDGEDEVVTILLPKITCTAFSWTTDEKEIKKKGKWT